MPSFDLEHQQDVTGLKKIVGIDEAGCGPWAGPLVVASCYIDRKKMPVAALSDVNDSKKLTPKRREAIFESFKELRQEGFIDYGIGVAQVFEINFFGLSQAIKIAMGRSLELLKIAPDHLLIDGIRNPQFAYPTTMVIKGDSHSYSIAAASIIAKVSRDRLMQEAHNDHPAYGWNQNAGYGTRHHQEALQRFGVTPYHRLTYAPIRKITEAL
jgi:ribonuclease HII